jgi:hypothetical protein
MKTSVICSAALFSLATFAFPANLLKGDISAEQLAEFTALAERITQEAQKKPQPAHAKRGFNADAQHVSTTGDHAYVSTISRFHASKVALLISYSTDRTRSQRHPWALSWTEHDGKPWLHLTQWCSICR